MGHVPRWPVCPYFGVISIAYTLNTYVRTADPTAWLVGLA